MNRIKPNERQLPAVTWQAHTQKLLVRIHSGRPLNLAEYLHLEEALAALSSMQAPGGKRAKMSGRRGQQSPQNSTQLV